MFAVVFPGQGSQAIGMAADFAAQSAAAREVFEQADDAFGGPLSTWMREGPDERLRRTEITQPAVLTASIAAYRALEPQLPSPPALFAGHSLGEYSALVAAGTLEFRDAVALVRQRGAHEVWNVRFGFSNIQQMSGNRGAMSVELIAYGTAVRRK